jgi:hypothetical protein
MFTDNHKGAPPDVQVHVWAEANAPQSPPAPEFAPNAIAAVPPIEEPRDVVTQGDFAVQLVEELGLKDRPDADEATDILARSGSRRAWAVGTGRADDAGSHDPPRSLTVAAAAEGWVTLTPEEGLLAFDTSAALLGVTIPETGDPGTRSDESSSPIVDMPPLMYLAPPPPDIYPYYLWQPVTGGYRWNGVFVSGVFILDLDRYSGRHHRPRHKHGHDHATMTAERIGHHFGKHMAANQHEFKDSARPHRSPASSGSYGPRRPQERPLVAPRSMTSAHRILRGSRPPEDGDSVSRVGPRQIRPGVRSINTRAVASEQTVFSTDGSSDSEGRRGGAGRGPSRGRGFSSR